jgi:hypothetical protein
MWERGNYRVWRYSMGRRTVLPVHLTLLRPSMRKVIGVGHAVSVEMRIAYTMLVGNTRYKTQLGKSRYRWMVGGEGVNSYHHTECVV